MLAWSSDDELFSLMKKHLFSAVIGDVLDKKECFRQFLSPKIRPLDNAMILAGRAMPVLEADVFIEHSPSGNNSVLEADFGLMMHALDDLKKNEVYICTGASPSYALWGEIMSTRASKLGAAGTVLNGYTRDTNGILDINYPTFSFGSYAQDQGNRGKVIDFRTNIQINGVAVRPGDIVFGDIDGVVIIPQEIEEEIIHDAFEKSMGERNVLSAIQNGMSAVDAFDKFGIM